MMEVIFIIDQIMAFIHYWFKGDEIKVKLDGLSFPMVDELQHFSRFKVRSAKQYGILVGLLHEFALSIYHL